ncbi:MAG: 30S ribosomal protein S8, partial [Candidatus Diapherotrites archaeon]|nr:30S ribosomal protein S8 [Candidatus Diapherotrites archaeon]
MTRIDPLADALISIRNHENAAKKTCVIRPASKVLGAVLEVMKAHEFIDSYELVSDGREGQYKIQLRGKINSCKAIKPRYAVKKDEYEKFEKRYLPAKDMGLLIVSTPHGMKTHL